MMTERAMYFRRGSHNLFGVLHEADGGRHLPYVFCHAFAEEKLWAHRVFVTFARELAMRGHPVLRLDFMGHGDSDGLFSDASVTSSVADIEEAVEWLRRATGSPEVGLVGMRLGATLAAVVGETRKDVRELVLWAPIVDGERYAQELLRINVANQLAVHKEVRDDRVALVDRLRAGEAVNFDGYDLSPTMYRELAALTLTAAKQFAGRCLVIHLARDSRVPPPAELQRLTQTYPNATLEIAAEQPFWREIETFYETAPNLFAKTLEWIGATTSEAFSARG